MGAVDESDAGRLSRNRARFSRVQTSGPTVNRIVSFSPSIEVHQSLPSYPSTSRPVKIAIPNLEAYTSHSGIGRVIHSLGECWGDRVRFSPARFESVRLPILRNNPHAVRSADEVDLILLPQLTGAQALRKTGGVPSVVIVHDVGIVDYPGDADGLDYLTRRSIRRSLTGLKHANHVVTVSDFTRDRLIHHLPEIASRVTTIPDGVSEIFLGFKGTRESSRNLIELHTKRRLGTPLLIYVG
ncbi:MAG: glycosyltransferase, partial [Thermomicrobiaceae bacterium]